MSPSRRAGNPVPSQDVDELLNQVTRLYADYLRLAEIETTRALVEPLTDALQLPNPETPLGFHIQSGQS